MTQATSDKRYFDENVGAEQSIANAMTDTAPADVVPQNTTPYDGHGIVVDRNRTSDLTRTLIAATNDIHKTHQNKRFMSLEDMFMDRAFSDYAGFNRAMERGLDRAPPVNGPIYGDESGLASRLGYGDKDMTHQVNYPEEMPLPKNIEPEEGFTFRNPEMLRNNVAVRNHEGAKEMLNKVGPRAVAAIINYFPPALLGAAIGAFADREFGVSDAIAEYAATGQVGGRATNEPHWDHANEQNYPKAFLTDNGNRSGGNLSP